MNATCDLGHAFPFPKELNEEPAAHCPTCGLITWNPLRPKRKKITLPDYHSQAFTDSDKWEPFCPTLGELDPAKKAARIKDGTLRVNPKTGNLEGYFETRAKYRQALKDQGVDNMYGEGRLDPSRQGWEAQYRDREG